MKKQKQYLIKSLIQFNAIILFSKATILAMHHLSITVQIKLSKYRNKTQFKSKNPFKTLLMVIKLMIMASTNRFNNLS